MEKPSYARYQLIREIIDLSDGSTWEEARSEWDLASIHNADSDDPEICLCGKYPIIEVCVISNRLNGNSTHVGNCCIKKFMELPSDIIFQAIRRVKQDITRALNDSAINFAHQQGWIDDWQHKFYLSTWRKRTLTGKQERKRVEINQRILNTVERSNAT